MGRNPYDPITGMRGRRVQEPKRQQPAIRQDAGGQNIGRDANEHNVTAGKREKAHGIMRCERGTLA